MMMCVSVSEEDVRDRVKWKCRTWVAQPQIVRRVNGREKEDKIYTNPLQGSTTIALGLSTLAIITISVPSTFMA